MVENQDDPTAMSQCQRDYDAAVALVPAVGEKFVTNDWNQGEEIEFSFLDSNGATHTFNTVKTGQYIDMVNEDGTGYMLGEIYRVAAGQWYENPLVYYNVVKSSGTAQGKVRVRIFSVTDEITSDDLTNFVRKDGDTISGSLHIDNKLTVGGQALFNEEAIFWAPQGIHHIDGLTVLGNVDGVQGSYLFGVTIERENTGNPDYMEYYGPSNTSKSLVNRKWVEEAIQNAFEGGSLADEYLPITGGVLTGNLVLDTNAGLYTEALIKSTRTSGYAFQVYDEESDSNPAFIHSNGNIRGAQGVFTGTLEVRGSSNFKTNIIVDGNVNSNGGWVKGNWGIDTNGKG